MNYKELKMKLLDRVEEEMTEATKPLADGLDLAGLVRQAKATARAQAFVEIAKLLDADAKKPRRD